MGAKAFSNIFVNFLLMVSVCAVFVIGFVGNTQTVFNAEENIVYYNGNQSDAVSLMFNVYWGTEYIHEILEILNEYDATCTFFVGGSWVAQHPDILTQIVACGHEIANHGYFHKQHSRLTLDDNVKEIDACGKLVWEYANISMNLFAPPSGDFDNATIQACSKLDYNLIMWTKDTIDWRDKDSELIFTRATKNIEGGDFVLMHPTQHTTNALPRILQFYASNGFSVVTVSQNIGEICNTTNNTKVD